MAYGEQTITGRVASTGALTLTVKPTGRQTWIVSQVSISMTTAPFGALCNLKKNGVIVTPMIASGDAAGGDPPVQLRYNERLTVEWTGATSGDVGTALIIYDDGT